MLNCLKPETAVDAERKDFVLFCIFFYEMIGAAVAEIIKARRRFLHNSNSISHQSMHNQHVQYKITLMEGHHFL